MTRTQFELITDTLFTAAMAACVIGLLADATKRALRTDSHYRGLHLLVVAEALILALWALTSDSLWRPLTVGAIAAWGQYLLRPPTKDHP